ncbi:MAG: hypothetical protein GY859_29270 [Desulfobacterales bacterium]|nr:hypothetical protein [Desulfobacterales bacterium]
MSEISAVLFLLGRRRNRGRGAREPCLILNKRSQKVRQPGDLCCPGGGVSPRLDRLIGKFLTLPGTPLTRWPHWPDWRRRPRARGLPLLLGVGLREALEEMRLNPFGVRFLGPMPMQRLVMFRRSIYPMAAWVSRQRRFFPNWEVDKVIYIPLESLLNPANYRRYSLRVNPGAREKIHRDTLEYPGFLHQDEAGAELLWGATYRITMNFMDMMYGFKPPGMDALPILNGNMASHYLTGGR